MTKCDVTVTVTIDDDDGPHVYPCALEMGHDGRHEVHSSNGDVLLYVDRGSLWVDSRDDSTHNR